MISWATVLMVEEGELKSGGKGEEGKGSETVLAATTTEWC